MRTVAKAIREERSIVPAAEWLVDNFHIVDEQLREIRDDLPAGSAARGANLSLWEAWCRRERGIA